MGNALRRPGPGTSGPRAAPLGSPVSFSRSPLDRRGEADPCLLGRSAGGRGEGLDQGDGGDGRAGTRPRGVALRSGSGGGGMTRDVPLWWKNGARWVWILAALLVAASLWMVTRAPVERIMGPVQKIVYIHVPSAIVTLLAFGVTFAAGIAYLATRQWIWDAIGAASCEVGLVFASVVMITGPLWARSAWNTWWTWEPRLTTFFILWILYAAYQVIRSSIQSSS